MLAHCASLCQLRPMSANSKTQNAKTMVDISANCACGKTDIAIKGPILTTMLCACTDCQRASSSGHTAIALVPHQAMRTSGPLRSFARPADSGATVTRYFCPDCATTLYSTSSRVDGAILISPGLFTDSNWYTPKHVIFNKSRTHWDSFPENIPAYDTYKED